MLSRTRQCWFWFMSPGAKSNSTQFIKPQLSAHHVVPTMPKDDKARTCQKHTVSKRHSSSWKAWDSFMTMSPWPHQSAHVLPPGSVRFPLTAPQYNTNGQRNEWCFWKVAKQQINKQWKQKLEYPQAITSKEKTNYKNQAMVRKSVRVNQYWLLNTIRLVSL